MTNIKQKELLLKAQLTHKPVFEPIAPRGVSPFVLPLIFLGFLSAFIFIFAATQKGWAMVVGAENCADGHPCKVVFTLDEENNIVLEEVSGHQSNQGHRNEGVLRLTTDQAKAAAKGPKTKSNILAPKLKKDEFSATIKALAEVPGLHFLKGESRFRSGRASNKKTNTASGNLPHKCQQIEKVMAATLEEAEAGTLNKADVITSAEVRDVCPQSAAQNLISWYETEKEKHLSY